VTVTVTALPLIFTNVEAEDSPTRQRGFQVWQAARELNPEARKEIARRIDDFKLPMGTPADAAVTRDVYFKVSEKAGGFFAVARTVPLPDKDKFGRGGKFFAHVFAVSADDFARLDADPFALFDAVTFWERPAQVKELHPDWKSGVLSPLSLEVLPVTDTAAVAPALLSTLAGHLDRDAAQRKTVVLVGKPADVAEQLRAIFRGLPPALRAKSEFDTLSGGASLTQVPCAFAGCPSPEALKLWAFRRIVKLDASGMLAPAADAPPAPLAAELLKADAWAVISSATRDASWEAAKALAANDLAAAATQLDRGAAVQSLLEASPALTSTLDALKAKWGASLPPAVAAVPGIAECLGEQLDVPLPELLRVLQGDLRHIQEWVRKSPEVTTAGRRLDWVLSRLLLASTEALTAALSHPTDGAWFRDWLRDDLVKQNISAVKLRQRMPHGEEAAVSPKTIYDAWLYLNSGPRDTDDMVADVRLRHAARTGGLTQLITRDREHLPPVEDCLAYLKPKATLGWLALPKSMFFVGAFVFPRHKDDAELMQHCVGIDGGENGDLNKFGPRALRSLYPEAKSLAGYKHIPAEATVPPDLQPLVDQLFAAKGKRREVAIRQAADELQRSDSRFKLAAGYIRQAMTPEPWGQPPDTIEPVVELKAGLFGFRLRPVNPNQPDDPLPLIVEAVLAAYVPRLDRETPPAAGLAAATDNFAWLLSRL
jgi:hypothetical protein